MRRLVTAAAIVLVGVGGQAQVLTGKSIRAGTGGVQELGSPPGEGRAIGPNRITQEDITSGALTLGEIRTAGGVMFTTPFRKADGYGDGPDGRPTLGGNGTFLRVNGLDTQSCIECHFVTSNRTIPATLGVGGGGGIGAMAMGGATEIDVDDEAGNGYAFFNGRAINPPFVFGAGGVEMVGKEMTSDLQELKAFAQANSGLIVSLDAKGVNFGTISYDAGTDTFDTSNVQGLGTDLVVRPFGRKGEFVSIRAFDVGALQFHKGMQPVEVVGENVDDDGDGVVNEILVGELSAMHVFGVTMERPVRVRGHPPQVIRGRVEFARAGCAACHVPVMQTRDRHLPLAFPEVAEDPSANVFMTVDLRASSPGFRRNNQGGVRVRMFSDLKRHDMGPGLSEATGGRLDAFFITPRLWGLADSAPYLHDGRALTVSEAILAHGGEGQDAGDNFAALPASKKIDLLAFLHTLRAPEDPNAGVFGGSDDDDDDDDDD